MLQKAFPAMLLVLMIQPKTAEARYLGPILVKETKTAITVPELTKAEGCEIFADRVVVVTKFGEAAAFSTTQTIATTVQGDLQGLLQKAQKGFQLRQQGAFDVPSIRHFGNLIGTNDVVQYVGLTYENARTGELIINQAAEARLLVNIVESLCASTLKSEQSQN